MVRVLLDCRVDAVDGIGRYTDCTRRALLERLEPDLQVVVLTPTRTPRYSLAEGRELGHAAHSARADVVHLLDYRVPLDWTNIPLIVTVHDVLRLLRPDHCYTDHEFSSRFGHERLAELSLVTSALRDRVGYPCGAVRSPKTIHEEFHARMLMLASIRAAHIVVPTQTVRRQLRKAIGSGAPITASAYGVDHWRVEPGRSGEESDWQGRYLLYVGQARPHKRLPALVEAYQRSRAPREHVRLICVGSDFEPGARGTGLLRTWPCDAALAVGTVSDGTLAGLYADTEALIHLSEHEGFGFTPLEAMSHGAPVIASDIAVLRETLGPHAAFVDPGDPRSVAHAIDLVLAARGGSRERDRRVRWARRYRWSRHARDLVAVYRQLAA